MHEPNHPPTGGARGAHGSDDELDDLMRVAHAAAQLAYSPYSRVRVGAALVGEDGQVYTGCNVENASYGLTLCAERAAVVRAVAAGERRFRAIAIATDRPQALMPCGACRQFLLEFAPQLWIHVQGAASERETVNLADLLPRAFSPADLPGAGDTDDVDTDDGDTDDEPGGGRRRSP